MPLAKIKASQYCAFSALLLALGVGSQAHAGAPLYLVVTTVVDGATVAGHCTAQAEPGVGKDAACSLRDALAQAAANPSATIQISFSGTIFTAAKSAAANTITLTSGALSIPDNTSITGATTGWNATKANLVTVSGAEESTVFTVSAGVVGAQLTGLSIVDGKAETGGGVMNAGTLKINECSITSSKASASGSAAAGGGVWNSGTLTITDSTIAGNSASATGAAASGGGIENLGVLALIDSTVTQNEASADGNGMGGGIFTADAAGNSLTLVNATVTGNTADGAAGGLFVNYAPDADISPALRPSLSGLPGPGATLQALGDSITWGYDSTACPAPYDLTAPLGESTCWAGILASDLGYQLENVGVSGAGVGDVSGTEIYDSPGQKGSNNGQFHSGSSTITTLLIGQNDNGFVNGESEQYFNGTRYVSEWEMQHEDVAAFTLTPNKTPAASTHCTAAKGWTTSTLWAQGGLQTTTNGTTLSCSIVGSTAYVSVMAEVGNASYISMAVDGGAAKAYPYILSSKSNVLGNTASGELFRIANLPASGDTTALKTRHTITITANVSGASPVYLNWLDGNGNEQSSGGSTPILFSLSPYISTTQTLDNGHIQNFRTELALEAADFKADGLNEVLGDLTIPCTVLPLADPAVSLCDLADGTHPTNSGHALIAAYVEQLFKNYAGLSNSIVAGNTAPTGADIFGVYTDAGGNQVSVSALGLAPLGSYGGPTETMPPLPQSPALCTGTAAGADGATTDQRGLPRSTTYGSTACVNAGAVQTNYALSFSTEPPHAVTLAIPIESAPTVELTESGAVAVDASGAVTMTDSAKLLTGTTTANLAGGGAAFNNLVIPSPATNDTLQAKFALTSTISLTATSSSFSAATSVPEVSVGLSLKAITTVQQDNATVTVAGPTGMRVPTGTVSLASGAYRSSVATLANGAAAFTIPAGVLGAGTDTLTATYAPDTSAAALYAGGAGTAELTVSKPANTLGTATPHLLVSPVATIITTAETDVVLFSVTGASGMPAGSMTLVGGSYSGSAALTNGAASITIPAGALASGKNTLLATYSGNGTYASGTGSAVVTVASLTSTGPGATSITPGQAATPQVTWSAGGYAGTLNLTCLLTSSPAGAVSPATCSLSPAALELTAGGSGATTVTVSTTASSTTASSTTASSRTVSSTTVSTTTAALPAHSSLWGAGGSGAVLAAMILCGIPARRRRGFSLLALLCLAVCMAASGCGSSVTRSATTGGLTTPGTTAGDYTFTVTATDSISAAIMTTTPVTITVK